MWKVWQPEAEEQIILREGLHVDVGDDAVV